MNNSEKGPFPDKNTGELTKPAQRPRIFDDFRRSSAKTSAQISKKVHARTEKSKTLMRAAVRKPMAIKPLTSSGKTADKPAHPVAARSTPKLRKPTMAEIVKPERALYASAIKRSKMISKFGRTVRTKLKTDVVPVHTAPSVTAPEAKDKQHTVAKTEQPAALPSVKLQHKLAKYLGARPSTLAVVIISLCVLTTAGVLAYFNFPPLTAKVAALRSGVSVSLPAYRPTGFSVKAPIKQTAGSVIISFAAADNKTFSISERNSNWSSEALLENYVKTKGQQYQTVQSTGRTIYIYDNASATWTDNGIWYEINGNASLSATELLQTAESL